MADQDRPLRAEDFTPKQLRGIQQEISRIGKQTKSGAATAAGKLRKAAGGTSEYAKGAAAKARRIEQASRGFKDKPITLAGAVQRRQEAFGRAIQYAREESVPLPGAGWYFGHAGEIDESRGTIPFRSAAAGSAAMSPGKDPKTEEIPAFQELSRLHNDPEHTVTYGGETTPAHKLTADYLAWLATIAATEKNQGVEPSVTSSSPTFSQAGLPHERMIARGISAIRGDIPAETANNPMTGPKTSSYFWSITHAGEASPDEATDYEGIAHHIVHGDPNQGMFQFSRKEHGELPETSILSPDHDTAEDTWMQAITSGQALSAVNPETGRVYSPAKRAVDKGSSGEMSQFSKRKAGLPNDTSITSQGAVHAFNNLATRQAARGMGPVSFDQFGNNIYVPSVMMQEVAWTQARRDAGGDAPFNQEKAAKEKAAKAAAKDAKKREKEQARLDGTQLSLF